MFRRLLLILLGLLVVTLVVADRVGAVVVAHVLAEKVQTDEHLPSRPGAHIGGIPFLTQAANGKYSDVTITARHLTVNGVPVTELVAYLHGVHISASAAIKGNVKRVPVDRTDGTVTISYADINRYLASKHLTVSRGAGGTVKLSAHVAVAGQTAAVSGAGRVTVSDNVVTLRVSQVAIAADGHTAGVTLPSTISASLPLRGLPFRISLANVTATSAGVVATGTVRHVVLGS